MGKPKGRKWPGAHESKHGLRTSFKTERQRKRFNVSAIHDGEAQMSNALLANGADGISDIEGKVARARDERAWATSEFQCFRSLDVPRFCFLTS